MTPEEHIKMLEETRRQDVDAMLTALLLIERGQPEVAVRVLTERLPEAVTKFLRSRP